MPLARPYVIAAAVLLAMVPVAPSPARAQASGRPTAAALQRVADSLAVSALAAGPAAGMSILVVRGSDTLAIAAHGLADLEHEVPATPQTVYRIGSLTKQFTAAAIHQLAEQKRLALDDAIGTHLPRLPDAWTRVTVRQLLNHSSGIPNFSKAGPRWAARARRDLPYDSLIAVVRDAPLDFASGTAYGYSNTGYYLLATIVERVSGKTWPEYVAERLAGPAGLGSSRSCALRAIVRHRAMGYTPVRGTLMNHMPLSLQNTLGAGDLCSTVGDLVAWQKALASGRVVSAESYRAMTTPEGPAAPMRVGHGLSIDTLGGQRRVAAGGETNGFTARVVHLPAESLSIAVTVNSNGPWARHVADNLARSYLGLPLAPTPPPRAGTATPAPIVP